jgi:PIN domain nuclease of toxin-antitoxin system
VNFLVDTHLILWGANAPEKIPEAARSIIDDRGNEAWFSAASMWEVAIKRTRYKHFLADVDALRRGLLANAWRELVVDSNHVSAVLDLPSIHADPFDRMLIAQAKVAGLTLLTSDKMVARYPGNIMRV